MALGRTPRMSIPALPLIYRLIVVALAFFLEAAMAPVVLTATPAGAPEDAVAKPDNPQQYLLRYRFKPGDHVRTKVVHQASVRTTIEGTSQTAKTVSVSVKVWKVVEVDREGRVTFEHAVEFVDMKNDVTGRETVSYDSREDDEPPAGFEDVARRVGVPLTRVVMDKTGTLHQREELAAGATTPTQMVLPLPEKKVIIGSTWTFPDDVVINLQNGGSRKIKCRQRFELLAVENGIAKISIATQVLTPIREYPEGTIQFDMKAGRVIAQQIDLDRRVTGYPNAKSSMHYRTRFTETLLPDSKRTARRRQKAN
jgi:hypothetical protein